jgi:hypothetical protein
MLFGLNLYQRFTLATYQFFRGDLAFIDKIPGAQQSPRWNLRLHEAAEFARISIRHYSAGTYPSEDMRRPLSPEEIEHLFLDIFGSPVDRLAESVLTPQVRNLANTAYENCEQDATLDGERLAILSDALEDAGLSNQRRVCQNCRGFGRVSYKSACGVCGGAGLLSSTSYCPACTAGFNTHQVECAACRGLANIEIADPVLEHLRSPGPHYVGCWAVDLARGV